MTDTIQAMPHAPMAEKSILSMMFRKPAHIARAAAEGLTDDAFHLPANRILLERLIKARDMQHLTAEGEIDLTLLVQQAAMDGILDRMGGAAEVCETFNYANSCDGWSSHADQLRECKARRIAVVASQSLADALDSEEAIRTAKTTLEALQRAITAKTKAMNAKQATDDFITKYVSNAENGDIPGISTGIGEIDALTGGMKPGELWTVGGPSSSGKSVLMYQVAGEFVSGNRPVAIFSLELMTHEIIGRLITLTARVPHDSITNPKSVTKSEMVKIQNAVAEVAKSRLWIDATGGQSLDSISSEAERIRDIEGDLGLIVVDYIQICKGERQKGESREREIASISGGLKQLAKKMNCAVITGTQLNDDGKTRESRAIEQDSDILMLIQDDGILMKKNRNGKRDQTVNLALDGSAQRFRYFRPQNS